MSLEIATYIPDLVASNPAPSDPVTNAADHMRMIKGVLKATFPNFISGPLQSTQAQIDSATLAVDTNGITIFADAGVNFKTNTTDGISNPAAGEVDVKCGAAVAARFMATSAIFPGTVASQGFTGPGVCPIGSIMIWPSDTLPSGSGVWAWCNGATYLRSNTALYNAIGTTYGTGDGVTTANLPNYQEVTLVGKSTMGGAASPGLLASIAAGIKGVLNGLFGTDTYTQQQSDLPNVKPAFTGTASGQAFAVSGNEAVVQFGGSGPGGSWVQTLNLGATAAPAGTVSSINDNVTQTAMPTHQPSRAVNFIIRIA